MFYNKTSDLRLSPVPSATDDTNSTLVATMTNLAGTVRHCERYRGLHIDLTRLGK